MESSELDYELPPSAIATVPVEPRDRARLLVDGGPDRAPTHRHVSDLPAMVGEGDVIVVNDTRVRPARLFFDRPGGGTGEVLLLDERPDGRYEALVRPSAKLDVGAVVEVSDGLSVEFGERTEGGSRIVGLLTDGPVEEALAEVGTMPLPPYLGGVVLDDPDRYQTVYARRAASAAAPTAGLHFTSALLDAVKASGARICRVELVVGLDTFRPVRAEVLENHPIHTESYRVPQETWDAVESARRVIAVGTTSVRALEAAAHGGDLEGRTDLFILPGHDWKVVDAMLTNFHLPRTTLLAMVEAFVGPRWKDLYSTALASGYRFLSFGDAMFLSRATVGGGAWS